MTGLTPEEKELEATYGPLARFSDFKRTDRITYRLDGGEERQAKSCG